MKVLKMCLNWKALAGLAAVGVGIYLVAPGLVLAALPVLLLSARPLSMLLIMRGVQHPRGQGMPQEPDVGLTRKERSAGAERTLPCREWKEAVEA